MINLLSTINIIDNSGAKEGIMIKRLIPKTSTKNSPATVGHVISISVRKTIPFARKANSNISGGQPIQKKNRVQRKHVYQALIVRTKKKNNFIKKNFYAKNSLNQIIDKSDLNNSKLFDSNNGEYINKYIQNSKISPYFNKKNDYFFKNNLNMQKFGGHLIS